MKNFSTLALLLTFESLLTTSAWATNTTISNTQTTAITLNSNDSLSVTATGTLNVGGGKNAVGVQGNSTISNLGTILESGVDTNSGRAIRDKTGGLSLTITNGSISNSTALIESVDNDAIQMNVAGSTVSLSNYGKIVSMAHLVTGGGQAIDWNALNTTTGSNTLYNYYSGMILSTDADAVRPGMNGVVLNSGTIKSNISLDVGGGDDGIDAQNNTGIIITNDASLTTGVGATNLIEGARHGITGGQVSSTATFTMSITNNVNGTIKGDNGSGVNIDGFNANEVVTINNAGTITGNGSTLSGTSTAQDGDGVDVDGVVNITNSGTIKSLNAINDTSEGVTVGGGTITNSGTIEGSVATPGGTNTAVGRGITLAGLDKDANDNPIPIQKIYTTTVVTNSGLIKGDTDSGIAILGISGTTNYSVTITNTLGGTIEGAGSVAVIDGSANANGVGTASANNETVINYGTIKADGSGKAISLGSGNNSVQIVGGVASVIGDMSGGLTGTNTAALTIDPTAGQTFNYGGVISNFGSVEIKSGTVNFSGANAYVGTTTIDAATLTLSGSGSIGTTSTLTIESGGIFNLGGGSVTVGSLINSGTVNNGTVKTSGSGTVSGLSGSTSFNKTGAGTTSMTGTNTYTGGTTVSGGKLAVDGTVNGNVSVTAAAEVGGHGSIGGTISGAGLVGPGNSPGILTASSVDPSGGLTFGFELTQVGAPTWSNASPAETMYCI